MTEDALWPGGYDCTGMDPHPEFCRKMGRHFSAPLYELYERDQAARDEFNRLAVEDGAGDRRRTEPCKYLGDVIRLEGCTNCPGDKTKIKIFACGHPAHRETRLSYCWNDCPDNTSRASPEPAKPKVQLVTNMKWAYGITTIPARRAGVFAKTLSSLANAGFDKPQLFVDGCSCTHYEQGKTYEDEYGLAVTYRFPAVRTFGNWFLSLLELYLRNPHADRYAIFQDDLICSRNLKSYLEQTTVGQKCYWNLYTFPHNEALAPQLTSGKKVPGWFAANQLGQAAVGLVFDRDTTVFILQRPSMIRKPLDPTLGWQTVDGAVSQALVHDLPPGEGWKELCHSPSLVQHTGKVSSIVHDEFPEAPSFRGEDFDLLTLLG